MVQMNVMVKDVDLLIWHTHTHTRHPHPHTYTPHTNLTLPHTPHPCIHERQLASIVWLLYRINFRIDISITYIYNELGIFLPCIPVSHVFPIKPAAQEQPTGSGTQNKFPLQFLPDSQTMEQNAPQLLFPHPFYG